MPDLPDEKEISALLRLKRFEQPRPEYFEQFLRDFQRHQRSEMLRKSVWEIARDRTEAFFAQMRVSQLAYAGASVAVLCYAGASVLQAPVSHFEGAASVALPAQAQVRNVAALSLKESDPFLEAYDPTMVQAAGGSFANQTRYVMDARPASYEPPSSF